MDWETMRAHYEQLLQAAKGHRGLRQEDIAAASGLRQGQISRIKSNENLGPAVEIFIRAIEGLGLRPSEFFAEIEDRPQDALMKMATEVVELRRRLDRLEATPKGRSQLRFGYAAGETPQKIRVE